MGWKCVFRTQLPGLSDPSAGAGLPVRRPGNGAKLDSMTVNPGEGHGSA